MNIFIQRDPRSIALRAAGTNPYALIFRHALREEDSSNRCVVEFLPWKDVSERGDYKLLSSVEVYGSLGLIDVDEGIYFKRAKQLKSRRFHLCHNRATAGCNDSVWRDC